MNKRFEKWKSKIDGSKAKKAYEAQKEHMITSEKEHTPKLVKIEEQIKQLTQGQPIIHLPYYIIFGKEIYKKINKFTTQTLLNEIVILENKWEARGLDPIILEIIKNFYVQPYAYIRPFRLDISELDGSHVLS